MTAALVEPRPTVVRRTTVAVVACDPVTGVGVASQLRFCPELEVLAAGQPGGAGADVVVVVADELDEERLRQIRFARRSGSRTVLVASVFTGDAILAAVDAGVSAIIRRADASMDSLARAVTGAARGHGVIPPDLLGKLLQQVGTTRHRDQRPALRFGGLSERELQVLRLLADGRTTLEIAREMCYSERTVKNAIQALTSRLQLRNRSHAVAYAIRQGLI